MPTSLKSVLRVFLGSTARGIFLCETTPTKTPASYSWRERFSLQPSPPKLKKRTRREPDDSGQPRQHQRRGEALALGHLLRVLIQPFPFGGPVAEETLNLCYMFGRAYDKEPVEKTLMTSSSAAITFQDSVNSNLATLMVDSGASGHYFNDAIIRDLKHRLQDYLHLATDRKILTAGGALLNGTVEGVLQGLVTNDYGNQILVWVEIEVVLGIGRNLFSVMTAAKKGIVTIFDYKTPRLEGLNVTVPLRSESGDLYSFELDLSADGYSAKKIVMNSVTNIQVLHRPLGHLHAQPFQLY